MNDKERFWLDKASRWGGSFIKSFALTCFCADAENFALLQPTLRILMEKYPNYSDKEKYD